MPGAIAFAVSFALIALMLRFRWHWAVDLPNHRSLHSNPTPRTGGMAIIAGLICAIAAGWAVHSQMPLQALGLAVILSGVSLADDRHDLPIGVRLAAHLIAAGLFTAWLQFPQPSWWSMAVAVLAIAAMTNFYNFMDGSNGLAGGMAVIGFATYGAASMGAPGFAACCFAIAAAAGAFLCFNLGGRIFMGDGGSVPLGYLAATLGLEGWYRDLWPLWFGPLVFAPFLVDATVTLLRRAMRGDRFWQAHREHYYQRVVRMGASHGQLALMEYALMAASAASAMLACQGDDRTRVIAFATMALILGVCGFTVDRKWARSASNPARPT